MPQEEKKMTFVNCSNHPSVRWAEDQLNAAKNFGDIVDIAFPNVSPKATHENVSRMAVDLAGQIETCHPNAVMVQGEMTLTYELVRRLKADGIVCLAACSERRTIENGNVKTSVFEFVQFRSY